MKITAIVIALLVPASVNFIFALIRYFSDKESRKMTTRSFCVRLNKGVALIGVIEVALVTVIFCGLLSEPTYLLPKEIMYVFLSIMAYIGMYLIFYTLAHKIVVSGNQIVIFSPFKRRRVFSFDDIIFAKRKIVGRGEKIIVELSGGKKFTIENIEISYDRFIKVLHNKVSRSKLSGFDT